MQINCQNPENKEKLQDKKNNLFVNTQTGMEVSCKLWKMEQHLHITEKKTMSQYPSTFLRYLYYISFR